ncbi:GGDEF domain-containing protein [Halomonadaceae bacterium KBTZ08]
MAKDPHSVIASGPGSPETDQLPQPESGSDRLKRVVRSGITAAFFIHLGLLLLFVGLEIWILAAFNVLSVSIYTLCAKLTEQITYFKPVLILAGTEIIVHAALASRVTGWESGFHYYVLGLAPLIFISPKVTKRTKSSVMGTLILVYIAISAWTRTATPWHPLDPALIQGMHYMNLTLALTLLALLLDVYSHSIQRTEHNLQTLAETDKLTGLPNRRGLLRFTERLEAQPDTDQSEAVAFIIDVDHFKSINDRYGHSFGDSVLRTIANTMQMQIREQDTLARWGGEEFLLLLQNADLALAFNVAERIREAISEHVFEVDDQTIQVTITSGIALWEHGESFEMCVDRADEALYHGKRSGRNQSVVYRAALSQPL